MKTFETQILTPDGAVFKGMVESVNLPGTEGNFQILGDHASLMSALEPGEIKLSGGSTASETRFAMSVGFVEVHENNVTVLAEAAERVEKIDVERAKLALKRAEERLQKANNSP
ncbi:MAG: ATP synthase F1 subunit epsilon, partial [Balneolales bacterium]|nr:ATP synthase F1 subunit epsilon [Balneolales bacterium]